MPVSPSRLWIPNGGVHPEAALEPRCIIWCQASSMGPIAEWSYQSRPSLQPVAWNLKFSVPASKLEPQRSTTLPCSQTWASWRECFCYFLESRASKATETVYELEVKTWEELRCLSGGEGQEHGPFPVKGLNITINLTSQEPPAISFPVLTFFLFLGHAACLQDFSSLPEIKPTSPAVKAQNANHWTTTGFLQD